MKIFVTTEGPDGTGKITGWGSARGSDQEHEAEIEDDHEILTRPPWHFRLQDGRVVKDPALVQENIKKYDKQQEIKELKEYLAETDFYFIRQLDSGKQVPAEVKTRRQEIRKRMLELGL